MSDLLPKRRGLTIDPRVTDDNRPLWKLQLGDFGLHSLIFQSNLLDLDDFISISIAVDIRSQTNVAFHFPLAQTDHCLMKFVLHRQRESNSHRDSYRIAKIVNNKTPPLNSGGRFPSVFSCKERNQVCFVGFLQRNGLKLDVGIRWP